MEQRNKRSNACSSDQRACRIPDADPYRPCLGGEPLTKIRGNDAPRELAHGRQDGCRECDRYALAQSRIDQYMEEWDAHHNNEEAIPHRHFSSAPPVRKPAVEIIAQERAD